LSPLRLALTLCTTPAGLKAALRLIGLPIGPCRSPVSDLPPEKEPQMRAALRTAGPRAPVSRPAPPTRGERPAPRLWPAPDPGAARAAGAPLAPGPTGAQPPKDKTTVARIFRAAGPPNGSRRLRPGHETPASSSSLRYADSGRSPTSRPTSRPPRNARTV